MGVIQVVPSTCILQSRRRARWRLGVLLPVVIALAACTSSATSRPTTTSPPTTQHQEHAVVRWLTVAGAGGSFWLLGDYPCSAGTCFAVMQSTDDAATFTRVAAPSLAAPIGGSEGDFGVNDFVFANRDDGYFYVLNPNPHLYWTGDGGRSWRAVQPGKSSVWRDSGTSGPLASSIVTTHGRAYVLIFRFRSTGGYPTSYALASSAVTDDSWTTVPLPVPGPSTDNVGMAAFGSKVWLIVVPGGGGNASILVSEDEGRSYSPLPTTGMLGLSCRATATVSTTLWGFCGTGMNGYAVRSSDGGREWVGVTDGRSSNSGSILAISDTEAIFENPSSLDVWLTRDGGAHFTPVLRSQVPQGGFDEAFASTTTWLALGTAPSGGNSVLWRTTKGGRSWQPVKLPSL